MKTRNRIITVAVVGLTAIVALAGFGGHGRFGKHDPARMTRYANMKIDDTLEDLKATDAQKKAVHASTEKIIASGLALGNEHESTKAEVLAQWNATTADRTKLHNLVDARMDAFRSFAHSAVDELVKIHDTLTPAQRSEVSEHFKE